MLKHTKGNLLDLAEQGEFNIIIQGCNCHNTMGSGIAKEIRERYPEAYEADLKTVKGDKTKLGTYSATTAPKKDPSFVIINAYTQYDFNKEGEPFADRFEYAAFQNILDRIAAMVETVQKSADYRNSAPIYNRGVTKSWKKATERKTIHGGERFKIGLPYIGMGLAGGDKDRIIAMIEDFAEKVSAQGGSVTLVSYEP